MHRKQYRVKFYWRPADREGYYYTEWFETLGEATLFADEARREGLLVLGIENENEDEVSGRY